MKATASDLRDCAQGDSVVTSVHHALRQGVWVCLGTQVPGDGPYFVNITTGQLANNAQLVGAELKSAHA